MKRTKRNRIRAAAAAMLFCIVVLALWQWQTLARFAIRSVAAASAHVDLTFGPMTLAFDRAVFEDVRITSRSGEPIASIVRLGLTYDLRELLPGGRRRFGLKSVDAERPKLTVVRHPDNSYNIPALALPASNGGPQTPLIVRASVHDGSIEIVNESPNAAPNRRRLYVEGVEASADISSAAHSIYTVALEYGERPGDLYPVRGRGDLNAAAGYIDQHWTAPKLPIASAVNFVVNSPSLRLDAGMLSNVDARYFAISDPGSALSPHLTASAFLTGGRLAISGLSRPVTGLRGPVDAYDNGLLTPKLTASVAGAAANVSGGVYDLRDPHLRLAIRGSGDLARLRFAFPAAQQLPMRGPLRFGLLVEGSATKPLTWVDLRGSTVTYASTTIDDLGGFVAFDGERADIVDFAGRYLDNGFDARGSVKLKAKRGAIEMLLGIHSPPGALPYAGEFLPGMNLNGVALATADDPKAIAVRGLISGSSPRARMDGIFDVDSRGYGSIGPLHLRQDGASLYARIALDRPHGLVAGLARVRNFAPPAARASIDAELFGGEAQSVIGLDGIARIETALGSATAQARLSSKGGAIAGGIFGRVGEQTSFGASVAGTPLAPRLAGTVVVAGAHYRNFDVNANAGLAFAGGTLHIEDAAVVLGPLFIGAAGSVQNLVPLGRFAPRYDLATEVHTSDASALIAAVQPQTAQLVQGSLDANIRVRGDGMRPSIAGSVSSPEGSVNGLSFRSLHASVSGDRGAFSITSGRVVVGSTALAVSANATASRYSHIDVDAPHADLADFNDFFDEGDTFAGTGDLAARAGAQGTRILSSAGTVRFSGARFRRLALGNVAANWHSVGSSIATTFAVGDRAGSIRGSGSLTPGERRVNMRATASDVDLGTWLPMLGLTAPVTGRLDAQANVAGRYPDIALALTATVSDGTAGRLPIERFEVTASASHGRGTIQSARLDVPSLTATASGTFGLRPSDPLAMEAHVSSPNLGSFINQATGKDFGLSGTLDSIVRVTGTAAQPQLHDAITLQSLQRGGLTIPRVYGEIDARRNSVALRNGEVDFTQGKLLLAAELPVLFGPAGIAIGSAPIAASLKIAGLELSNFAALLPKGTQTTGRIDGGLVASGAPSSPKLDGSLALRGGSFRGPMEKSPITNVSADLSVIDSRATLQSRATVGGGSLTAQASAILASLRDPAASAFSLQARAENARLDLPDYFTGNLDGTVTVEHARGSVPQVGGDVSVSKARIPLNTFLNQKGGVNEHPAVTNVAFAGLRVTAGNDVRIRSANVDIGATGEAVLSGTMQAPALAGSFSSTGGSLNFYRTFNLESGTVSFERSSGVVPDVDAVATTFVSNPATAIRLHVTGPVTNMNLALASDPSYSREQILGLLVGAQQFGAVRGVNSTNQGISASAAAQQFAIGQVSTIFTRNMLQPLSSSLASALGFSNVQITTDLQTNLGINAVKAFGKNVNAVFAQSFGYPRTQSVTLEVNPRPETGLRFNWYTTTGPTLFVLQQPQPVGLNVLNINQMTSLPPPTGTNGVSFSFLHKFP